MARRFAPALKVKNQEQKLGLTMPGLLERSGGNCRRRSWLSPRGHVKFETVNQGKREWREQVDFVVALFISINKERRRDQPANPTEDLLKVVQTRHNCPD